MSNWTKAAIVALAFHQEFFWIDSKKQATDNDVYFYQ